MSTRKIALFGLLTALAVVLGYVESLIPVYLGAPGVKLGLANLVTMIALYCMGVREAIVINLVRIFFSGFTFGPASAILFSLAGAGLSLTVMGVCKKFRLFGMVGVSILGGVAHNIGQFLMAAFVEPTPGLDVLAIPAIRTYFTAFLFTGFNVLSITYFQSVMRPQYALTLSLLRGLFINSALVFVLPLFLGVFGIWLTMPVTEGVVLVFGLWLFTAANRRSRQ